MIEICNRKVGKWKRLKKATGIDANQQLCLRMDKSGSRYAKLTEVT